MALRALSAARSFASLSVSLDVDARWTSGIEPDGAPGEAGVDGDGDAASSAAHV